MAAAELAHDRVLLDARGSHRDLTAHRAMTAEVHRGLEAPQRRQIRKVANSTSDGWTPRLVLTPDVVHGLARYRDPTARFAGHLDHASRVRVGLPSPDRGRIGCLAPCVGKRIVLPAGTFAEFERESAESPQIHRHTRPAVGRSQRPQGNDEAPSSRGTSVALRTNERPTVRGSVPNAGPGGPPARSGPRPSNTLRPVIRGCLAAIAKLPSERTTGL